MARPQVGIVEERVQGAPRARGRRGWHEDAAAVGEELAGVGVRRRDDRPPGAHRVGQGPGHDLVEVRIRRDEDVGRLEPLRQLDPPDEPIDEPDVVLEPVRRDGRDQALPVRLALACE